MTPLTTPIFDFHQVISALTDSAYNYDSDSDSVASENQPKPMAGNGWVGKKLYLLRKYQRNNRCGHVISSINKRADRVLAMERKVYILARLLAL